MTFSADGHRPAAEAPSAPGGEAASLGYSVHRKALLALGLTCFLPLLVLIWLIAAYLMGLVEPGHRTLASFSGQALLVTVGLLSAGGGLVAWDIARSLARAADAAACFGGAGRALAERARELETAYARLEEVSFRDEVTGLYNRRFFHLRLGDEVARYRRFQQPISVVMLDVDGLKLINDSLGHAAGDAVLRGVGEVLQKNSRGINVICRYGGDEFAVLLVETSRAGAWSYAERVRRILSASVFASSRQITASFGVACLPDDVVLGPEELIQAADAALYAAKRGGKNRVAALPGVEGGPADPAGGVLGDGDRLKVALVSSPAQVIEELERMFGAPADGPSRRRGDGGGGLGAPSGADPAPAGVVALEEVCRATLDALQVVIATRDPATHAHSRRVHGYAVALARAYGVPEQDLRHIAWGVLLHDIGKIGIPDRLLFKPGPLTPDEWRIMRTHPELGYRMLEGIPFLRGALPLVLHHHERWDGAGYPAGLREEAIPLGARIFAVVDAFDAMTYDRPYSRAVPVETAREEVARSAGTHFDPDVVATFLAMPTQALVEMWQRHVA